MACSTTCASTCGACAGLRSGKAATFWLTEGVLRDTGLLLLPPEVWLPCLPLRHTPGRVRRVAQWGEGCGLGFGDRWGLWPRDQGSFVVGVMA